MKPPEIFETPRLRLRLPEIEDAETIFKSYAQDLEVVKYLTWKPHKSVSETRGFLEYILQGIQEGKKFPYVIERKTDKLLLGMFEIRLEPPQADMGYVLARAHWGKGYMTEAVKAFVEWGLAQNGLARLWSICDIDNPASARVMEKAGMKREGLLPSEISHPNLSDEPRDVYCYSIVK